MKKQIILLLAAAVIAIGIFGLVSSNRKSTSANNTNTQLKQEETKAEFDKSKFSTSDPASIWVVVNKQHPLKPVEYAPDDLTIPNVAQRVPGDISMNMRRQAAGALATMFSAAKADGQNLMIASAYRSYNTQKALYNRYVRTQGKTVADTQSARAGFSEHQTGLAFDVEPASKKCEVEDCFAETPEGMWVAANAYKYGYIVRYNTADQAVTGYKDESWHLRYVGEELSNELHRTGTTTLEKFFGISGGDY